MHLYKGFYDPLYNQIILSVYFKKNLYAQSFWKLVTLQSPLPEQKQVTACSILGQVSILRFNEISILTTAAGQFKFSQSDLKWVPHESIACDWHISESTMAEIWSQISYRVAFLFANMHQLVGQYIFWILISIWFTCFLADFDSDLTLFGWIFLLSPAKRYFKTFLSSAMLSRFSVKYIIIIPTANKLQVLLESQFILRVSTIAAK